MQTQKMEAERRRAPRMKVFQPAEMLWGSGEQARVHLLNLSASGALVYGQTVPEVGEEVQLACGIALGGGRVAWRSGRRFGVQFDEPIAAAQVHAVLRNQHELIESANRRLGLVSSG